MYTQINPQIIGGMRVIVKPPFSNKVKRTWKERLFTLPWRPMQTHKTELHELIMDDEFLVDKVNQVIYCNEKMYQKLKAANI